MPKPNVREQLMEAGLRTLHSQGFNGCAVQDITQAAGVPKGSFYNHFESKEALALAALEMFWVNGTARRALLADASIDPVALLRLDFKTLSAALSMINWQLQFRDVRQHRVSGAPSQDLRGLEPRAGALHRGCEVCWQAQSANSTQGPGGFPGEFLGRCGAAIQGGTQWISI